MLEMNAKDKQEAMIGKGIVIATPILAVIVPPIYFYLNPDKWGVVKDIAMPYIKTGGLILIITLTIILTLMTTRWMIVRKREHDRYIYYRVLPHVNMRINHKGILEKTEHFAGSRRGKIKRLIRGREWFQWLTHCGKEGVEFYIGFPSDRKGVLRTLQNAYPEAEFHYTPATKKQHDELVEKAILDGKDENKVPNQIPFPKPSMWSGRMHFDSSGIERYMPFKPYAGDDGITNLVSYMEPGTWVSITFSPSTRSKMKKGLKKAQKKKKKYMPDKVGDRYSFDKEELKDYSTRLTGRDKVFKVAISLASSHKVAAPAVTHSIATSIGTIVNHKNGLDFDRVRNAVSFCPYPKVKTMEWTGQELANLIHLPKTNTDVFQERIKHLKKGQRNLKPNELNEGVTAGYMLHPINYDRKVKISWRQLTEHFFISGQTGSGKSSILVMMLQSVIDQWLKNPNSTPGFTLIDPASVTTMTMMNRLRKAEKEGAKVPWNKVKYFKLKDCDNPIAINLLHKNPWEDTDTVVNNIMDLFKTVYPGDRTKIDKYLKNTLTALIDDSENHILFGVNKFLSDEEWRKPIVDRMQDELLKTFWKNEDQKEINKVKDDVYSRVNTFEQSEFMRLIFGQPKMSLEIKKYMDEGYLVLFDTQGLGKINTKMIIGHIITQYHQVCQQRPQNPKEHFLVVDEAHMVQIPIMSEIIAVDRKFGLCLGPVTQYVGQFEQWLQDAIDGNVQNIMTGSQGEKESHIISKLTKNSFDADLLQYLPNNNAAILTKNKSNLTSCLIKTNPPVLYKPDGSQAKYPDTNKPEKEQEIAREEQRIATDWANEKALELQERDGESKEKIKRFYLRYLGLEPNENKAADNFFKGGDTSEETESNIHENVDTTESYSPPIDQSDILDEVENSSTESEEDQKQEKEDQKNPSFF